MIRYLLLGLTIVLLWLLATSFDTSQPVFDEPTATSSRTNAEVVFVIDGDTIDIAGGERVRLLGIDTPERDECFYKEAREFVRDAVEGRDVRLESDVTERDQYGRLLRHVFHSNERFEQHLNYELVKEGYAVVLPIPPDRAYRAEFRAAEAEAKAAGLGRHNACN